MMALLLAARAFLEGGRAGSPGCIGCSPCVRQRRSGDLASWILPHGMSMATVVNNEARWLPEWILYHRLVGVDHFYIYDDNSTDGTASILRPFVRAGLVTYHDDILGLGARHNIQAPRNPKVFGPQHVIVQHAARVYVNETRWLGYLDVDEFLTSSSPCLNDVLARQSADVGILRLVGSLFLPEMVDTGPLPRATLMVDAARMYVPRHELHQRDVIPLTKNIARPMAIAYANHKSIHMMTGNPQMRKVSVGPTALAFAHFRMRTLADYAVKKAKAYAGHKEKSDVWLHLDKQLQVYWHKARNVSRDSPLFRNVHALRAQYRALLHMQPLG